MMTCDALIVGGGPAGSTCARVLRQAGWDVLVIDRARFPRDKVCGGWLTPPVFELLDLEPPAYRAAGLTLQEITGDAPTDGRSLSRRTTATSRATTFPLATNSTQRSASGDCPGSGLGRSFVSRSS
jgi:flavin-dependent dehydrogenase